VRLAVLQPIHPVAHPAPATFPSAQHGPRQWQAFESHLVETKNHVKRVEQVFQMHGVAADTITCPAIDGIIKEADEVAGETDKKLTGIAERGVNRAAA